jgi:uncharacterized protein (DUF1015 family)
VATLNPFCGLRYDATAAGDLADVVAPPYDVISAAHRERLYARGSHNAVRLILSAASDPYTGAAATLDVWRRSGVLTRDDVPALYLYAQRFTLPDGSARERVGAIGALRLEGFDTGKILRHEKTRQHAKSDRLRLLEACRTSLSPIFGLVSDPGWTFGELIPARPADIDVADEDGGRHRVWRITDPAVLAALDARLAAQHVFIADGHHRYETALNFQEQLRRRLGAAAPPLGSAGYDHTMAYLTTLEDPGLVVLPTHRLLPQLAVPAADLRATLSQWFTIDDLPWSEESAAGACAWVEAPRREAGVVRIVVALAGGGALWRLSARTAALPFAADLPAELRPLDVTALHRMIFERALGLALDDRGGSDEIRYTQDASLALAAVRGGEVAAAFLLPATDLTAIRDVSMAGLTMPAKSTFFHPKLLTGLVFYPLDTPVEDGLAAPAP